MEPAFITPFLAVLIDVVRKQLRNLSRNLEYINQSSEEVPRLRALISNAIALLYSRDHNFQLQVDNFSLQDQVYTITSICYDAEDAVSEMEYGSMISMTEPITCRSGAGISTRYNNSKIKDVSVKLEKAMQNLQQCLQPVRNQLPGHARSRNSSFLPPSPDFLIERNEEVDTLVNKLTSSEMYNSLGVTITGMNGIGKSALAYMIRNHEEIRAIYPLRLWISLSGPFKPQEVIDKMVEDYRSTYNHTLDRNLVHGKLISILQKKKWLIVVDNLLDVTSSEEWSYFWSSIGHSPQQGKLVITTPNRDVAHATNTTSHMLNPLPLPVCEQLISRRIQNSPDAYDIKTLAQMCHGFPKVANILADYLNHHKVAGQDDQGDILLDRDLWEIQDFRTYITSVLESSYSMLEPHYVKICFAYFSLFPPGYAFKREELIHLWIGEGFLRCPRKSSLENIGKDYFRVLWKWFILQLSNNNNEQPRYELHNFTHMFSQLIASKTCLRLDEDMETRPWDISIRHLSLSCHELQRTTWNNILTLKGLRTFLPLCHIKIGSRNLQNLLKNLVYVRVLALSDSDIHDLPESIKTLKLLRYLDISRTRLRSLPNSVCQLYNLRILKFKGCPKLKSLPKNFKKLINLRHISWDIADMKHLNAMPSGIGNLTCLQALPLFTVGKTEGHRITELKDMNHLRGSICITNLENIQDEKDAAAAKLCSKTSIQKLELETSKDKKVGGDVFNALKPPKSVKELRLINYCHPKFPEWIRHLNKLEDLYLEGWQGCQLSSDCLRFPLELQSLTLKDMPNLLCLQDLEAIAMPQLHHLVIKECSNLISLPRLKHLTSLTELDISGCEELGLLPELPPSINKLTITNCDLLKDQFQLRGIEWTKIRRIPTLVIDGQRIPTSNDTSDEVHTLSFLP